MLMRSKEGWNVGHIVLRDAWFDMFEFCMISSKIDWLTDEMIMYFSCYR